VQTRLFDDWGRDRSKERKRHQSQLRKQAMLEVLFVVPTVRADRPGNFDASTRGHLRMTTKSPA
jgi:hypothetical protein